MSRENLCKSCDFHSFSNPPESKCPNCNGKIMSVFDEEFSFDDSDFEEMDHE
jgi:rubrerythrin